MTLHEEIIQILREAGIPLTTSQISELVNSRKNYIKKDGSEVSPFQIQARTRSYSNLFLKNKILVGLKKRDEAIFNELSYNNPSSNNPSVGDCREPNFNIEQNFINNPDEKIGNEKVHKVEFLMKFGFINIGSILDLQLNCFPGIDALKSSGVYAITKSYNYMPKFFSSLEVKLKGNVINPWEIERLFEKWVTDAEVLYYGLAGASKPRSLKSRLTDLINHSKGLITDSGPHKGGEIIWQLRGYEKFEVWILATGNPPEPILLEKRLLNQFYQITEKLPFANRKF